jgi:hypothetical protein
MKHLAELSAITLLDIYHSISLPISEKLDGSFISVGRDDNGKLYVQRKSSTRYYSADEWPQLAWANDFRAAHVVLEELFGWLGNNDVINFELIAGSLPNSVEYDISHNVNVLMITDTNVNGPFNINSFFPTVSFLSNSSKTLLSRSYVSAVTNIPEIVSTDGTTLELKSRSIEWVILQSRNDWIKSADVISPDLYRLLCDRSEIKHAGRLNNQTILDAKLNVTPAFVSDKDWKMYKREIIKSIQDRRAELRAEIKKLCNFTIARMERVFTADAEGAVIYYHQPIKLVNGDIFAKKNNFTHIVKYWLMGGRRPVRPCFLSRTKHWPLEKRLARLEVLRQRFVKHHARLKYENPITGNILSYSHPQLYKRTIVLFAEIREGLINGRLSV